MRFLLSTVFILLITAAGVTFAVLNHELVNINYYFGQASLPLSLLVAIVFSIGSLLGLVVGLWLLMKAKVKQYSLRQRLRVAEKEIENLRAIPLQDKH